MRLYSSAISRADVNDMVIWDSMSGILQYQPSFSGSISKSMVLLCNHTLGVLTFYVLHIARFGLGDIAKITPDAGPRNPDVKGPRQQGCVIS